MTSLTKQRNVELKVSGLDVENYKNGCLLIQALQRQTGTDTGSEACCVGCLCGVML